MEGKSSLGMKENVAGLLCYLVGWITGLIFYFLEKESKFVKFHAMQSIILFLSITVLNIVISILAGIFVALGVAFIVSILSGILGLIALICWILGMINAYQGKMFKFPIVGDIAEGIVNKK